MIQINLNGQQVFLLNDQPNWAKGYSTDFDFFVDQQTSLTKHETRRPYSLNMSTIAKFTLTLSGGSLRAMQGMLRQLKAQPVLTPFWPAVSFWRDFNTMPITGGLYLVFKSDWSNYAVFSPGATADGSWTSDSETVTADEDGTPAPTWPLLSDLVVPLMYGYIKAQSDFKVRSNDVATLALQFTEAGSSAYSLAFAAGNLLAGPIPLGYVNAPKLLPLHNDYNAITESLVVDVRHDKVGFRHPEPATFYPHDVYRSQKARYTISSLSKIAAALSWFQQHALQGESFWIQSGLAVGYLVSTSAGFTADGSWTSDSESVTADAAGQYIELTDTSAILAGDYICSFLNAQIYYAQVATINGSTLNLVNPFPVVFAAGQRFFALSLAKLSKGKVSVNWKSPSLAQFTLQLAEVRPETFLPVDETLNTTIGQLKTRVVLFNFWRDFGNGTLQNYYYTSAEESVAYLGNDYVSGSFECGDISTSVNMENDACGFTFSLVDNTGLLDTTNPLLLDIILGSEAPMQVQILFADLVNGKVQNAVQQFEGECATFNRKGNTVKMSCKIGSAMFENELLLLLKGLACPHLHGSPGDGSHLISQGCTGPDAIMKRANWKFQAETQTGNIGVFPYTLTLTALNGIGAAANTALVTADAIFLNYFASGWVELGAGANIQRRMIVGSTVPVVVSGVLTIHLTLHRWFTGAVAANLPVSLFPGCDGNFDTCKAFDAVNNLTGKFGNNLNFGGDPFTPIGNPTLVPQPQYNLRGGKK